MTVAEIAAFYDKLLHLENFAPDPSNNGLQICGNENKVCSKIAFAVDATLASINEAISKNADMLIVHHGLSWGGEPRRWNGTVGKRFAAAFKNDLALYAVHLPLDAHDVYGNNARLANLVGLDEREMFFPYHNMNIGIIGRSAPTDAVSAAEAAACGKEFKLYLAPEKSRSVEKIAVVSGGGGMEALLYAIAAKADMLITGEFDHTMYHIVQENQIHAVALGHYNSEVHGVKALQEVAENMLHTETIFIDQPTGL